MEITFSSHAVDMLTERCIERETAVEAVRFPDIIRQRDDGTAHYYKHIGEKTLHVIVNPRTTKIITLFFDRRGIRESKN
jgi:hypothetical protein